MAKHTELPKWNGEVSDTAACQPVREQKMGGVIVFCKGKCPAEGFKCGELQSRHRGTENPWQPDAGDHFKDSLEYRCVCRR